jgi:hypothetical protein
MIKISKVIKEWKTEEYGAEDALMDHFEKTKLRNWYDITKEVRRVWKAMFDEIIEQGSPIDDVIAAACAQSAHGIIAAAAEMMSVKEEDLWTAVDDNWTCLPSSFKEGKRPYAPIKSVELNDLIERVKKDWDSYEGGN